MNFERHTIGGFDLRIARVNRGDRPAVVLTNALPQSIRCWESVWDRLAEHVDLLAVDLAGFGRSTGSGTVMRPPAQADLLIKAMDNFGIESAFIVGPDIGVPVALWLASEHPNRVLGVNVFDGPGTWPTDFDPALRAATRFGLVRWLATRPPLKRRLMKQNFAVATSEGYHHFSPSDETIEEYRSICFDDQQHRNAFDYLGSYAKELPRLEERLPSITAPVLITWGAQDPFVLPSNADRLHALLPHSELIVFDDAGHFSHEDADDRWLNRLQAFIQAHQPNDRHPSGTER